MNIIVESFNFFSLLKIFFIKKNKIKFKDINIFYDSLNTKLPFFIFQFFFSNRINKLNWKFLELTSKNGTNLFWDLLHNDLEKILIEIISNIKKRDNIFNNDEYVYLEYYFFKFLSNSTIHPFSNKSALDIIFFINVIEKIFIENNQSYKTIIIMNNIPWRDIFSNYAVKKNINVYFVNFSFVKLNLYLIFNNLKSILKYFINIIKVKLKRIKNDNLKISKKKI